MNPYLDGDVDGPRKVLPCQEDPELWFAEGRDAGPSIAFAIRACGLCPVLGECAVLAAKLRPSHGVWAGKNWAEKRCQSGDRITRLHLGIARPRREVTS